MRGALVEELEGGALGLGEDGAAVLGVGVVADVGALVDEALAVDIDDQSVGIGVLLVEVGDDSIAGWWGVEVPGDSVGSGPVTEGLGAGVDGGLDCVAGVESGASHLGHVPTGTEVAGAHFGVGLEAASREHDGVGVEFFDGVLGPELDAGDAAAVAEQIDHLRAVTYLDAGAFSGRELLVGESFAGADGLDGESAVEDELAVDLIGLAAGHQVEGNALFVQPLHRGRGLADEGGGHAVVDQAVGDAGEVRTEVGLAVSANVDAVDFGRAEVGDDLLDVADAVVGKAGSRRR